MTEGIEALFYYQQLYPLDLTGILVKESVLNGVINGYPLWRQEAMPYEAIDLYAGNARRFRVFTRDANLCPINITGATCYLTFKQTASGPIVFRKSTAVPSEGMIGSADAGECFFYVLPADTQNIPICQYVFDVTIFLAGGDGPTRP